MTWEKPLLPSTCGMVNRESVTSNGADGSYRDAVGGISLSAPAFPCSPLQVSSCWFKQCQEICQDTGTWESAQLWFVLDYPSSKKLPGTTQELAWDGDHSQQQLHTVTEPVSLITWCSLMVLLGLGPENGLISPRKSYICMPTRSPLS